VLFDGRTEQKNLKMRLTYRSLNFFLRVLRALRGEFKTALLKIRFSRKESELIVGRKKFSRRFDAFFTPISHGFLYMWVQNIEAQFR
jgi:hypothetical protein